MSKDFPRETDNAQETIVQPHVLVVAKLDKDLPYQPLTIVPTIAYQVLRKMVREHYAEHNGTYPPDEEL